MPPPNRILDMFGGRGKVEQKLVSNSSSSHWGLQCWQVVKNVLRFGFCLPWIEIVSRTLHVQVSSEKTHRSCHYNIGVHLWTIIFIGYMERTVRMLKFIAHHSLGDLNPIILPASGLEVFKFVTRMENCANISLNINVKYMPRTHCNAIDFSHVHHGIISVQSFLAQTNSGVDCWIEIIVGVDRVGEVRVDVIHSRDNRGKVWCCS